MDLQAQKESLIERFRQINDINLIEAIQKILDSAADKEDEIYSIPEAHQKLVMERFDKIKYTVKIDPEALNDIQGITIWYNEQQPGLGRRFQTTAVKQINSLNRNPHIYAIRY